MKRRELVAGVGSVGVLSGAGALLWRGKTGSTSDGDPEPADEESSEPITVDPINASESITVPPAGADATVVTFFSTNCDPCHGELESVAAAREHLVDEHGDAVRFLGVPVHPAGTISDAALGEWWADHGGDWPVAFDPNMRLNERYSPIGFPVTLVLDGDGTDRWMQQGINDDDEIVDAVESVFESAADGSGGTGAASTNESAP